ncbi:unnamed protein product [Acanthoscelides obtectus]|uniref:Uncharacterized protein n=1 Tax=Acanthoscelides obtectus TaxID=200917 RepID=A0A9P0LY22_ACAOB|nr:unnamed protein product [Acanthoscelides obtectus]CAK1664061.1 Lysophospholipid acyltransferase 5 [Acanthoscelides obtectus]
MKRYLQFVGGQYSKKDTINDPPDCIEPAVQRLCLGIGYLIVFQTLGMFVSDEYLLTDEFANVNFFKKMLLLGIWGKYTLYKYILAGYYLKELVSCLVWPMMEKMKKAIQNGTGSKTLN